MIVGFMIECYDIKYLFHGSYETKNISIKRCPHEELISNEHIFQVKAELFYGEHILNQNPTDLFWVLSHE